MAPLSLKIHRRLDGPSEGGEARPSPDAGGAERWGEENSERRRIGMVMEGHRQQSERGEHGEPAVSNSVAKHPGCKKQRVAERPEGVRERVLCSAAVLG